MKIDRKNGSTKETKNRKHRVELLDNYFERHLEHGMPFDWLPMDYSPILRIWEMLHKETCLDLKESDSDE